MAQTEGRKEEKPRCACCGQVLGAEKRLRRLVRLLEYVAPIGSNLFLLWALYEHL